MLQTYRSILVMVCTLYGILTMISFYQIVTGKFNRRPTVNETYLTVKMTIHLFICVAIWTVI